MRNELGKIRRLMAGHERARGRRYPAATRQAVTGYALRRREDGASWSHIAGEVGMAFETVRRWCLRERADGGGIAPVEVVVDRDRTVGCVGSGVALVSPSGFRLEGLAPAEAVAALKALG